MGSVDSFTNQVHNYLLNECNKLKQFFGKKYVTEEKHIQPTEWSTFFDNIINTYFGVKILV